MNYSPKSDIRPPGKVQFTNPSGWFSLFFLMLLFKAAPGQSSDSTLSEVHKPYDILLQLYVSEGRFDYNRMWRNEADLGRLSQYIDTLETMNPAEWPKNEALAYWINLYNAATVELVLQNYPLESIKDIGGFMKKSPWSKKVVKVAGRELSLKDIKDSVIRALFKDARVHFALNNASLGDPPLSGRAYLGERLEDQLEAACYSALHDERWLKIEEKEIWLSKIFDWYKSDFEGSGGSIREFLAKYREDDRETIMDKTRELKFMDYNWDLNKTGL